MLSQSLRRWHLEFWLCAAIIAALRLILISDLPVDARYSPHDDSLYVERALHLISGNGLGPYDSRVLVKYPGFSFWLAGMAVLKIPHALFLNLLLILAALYSCAALLRAGINRWIVLLGFSLCMINPVTFGGDWLRMLREPLDSILLLTMVGAIAHMLLQTGRRPWAHLGIFAVVFAFSMFLREENHLLWIVFAMFAAALAWQSVRNGIDRKALVFTVAAVLLPVSLALAYEFGVRSFIKQHYGAPILHDFAEGEFPRLLAAIRSVESVKDNRLVMVTQERLEKLKKEVPALVPVIDRLPQPGPTSYSCRLQGVCSEWSSGWMPFWIKDAAFQAGLTPSLVAAQDYFRRVRMDIERVCAAGRFRCVENGEKFVPPMHLRWTRAYVAEGYRLVRMALAPELYPKQAVPVVELPKDVQQAYLSLGIVPSGTRPNGKLSEIRGALVVPHQVLGALVLITALTALAVRLWIADRVPLGPVALVGIIVASYSLLRLAALAYVAVFLGPFSERIMFSTYMVSILIALPFVAETLSAWWRAKSA